jgi:hypothetical protein
MLDKSRRHDPDVGQLDMLDSVDAAFAFPTTTSTAAAASRWTSSSRAADGSLDLHVADALMFAGDHVPYAADGWTSWIVTPTALSDPPTASACWLRCRSASARLLPPRQERRWLPAGAFFAVG